MWRKESKFFKSGNSYKEFEVLLIPRKEGSFVVPAFSVSTFNPETAQYEPHETREYSLVVNPSAEGAVIPEGSYVGGSGEEGHDNGAAPVSTPVAIGDRLLEAVRGLGLFLELLQILQSFLLGVGIYIGCGVFVLEVRCGVWPDEKEKRVFASSSS